jgi:hypothetical protein
MRKIFFLFFIISITTPALAQLKPEQDYRLNIGADLAYATGRFNYAHSLGYGISVQGEYQFADNSSLTVGTGYMYFPNKTFAPTDSIDASLPTEQLNRFTMVPLLFGMKIDNEGKFYVHPQFGFAFRKTPFISATYGLAVGVITSPHADFSLRFQAVQKKGIAAAFFSVRAGYVF